MSDDSLTFFVVRSVVSCLTMIPLLPKDGRDQPRCKNAGKSALMVLVLLCLGCLAMFLIFAPLRSSVENDNVRKSFSRTSVSDQSTHAEPIVPSDASTASDYYKADGHDDAILEMPNLEQSTCVSSPTNCGFNQYSGYLLGNNNREIHYWFVTADTLNDAAHKPVFFWTNGGPGCSGMDGLLTEHGPWRVMDDLHVHYNPYAWNTEVNMVYLEQPFGVGFSTVEHDETVVAGDVNAANDMDAVIRNWLTKFPEYQDNPLYLSSESWGGHYVPITTWAILQNNDAGQLPHINLHGFLLGNPFTDFYENTYGFVGDIYGHGLMTGRDWDEWHALCWDNTHNIDHSAVCSAIYTRAYMASWNANVYALDWPQCVLDEDWTAAARRYAHQSQAPIHEHAKRFMGRVLDAAADEYATLRMNMEREELLAIYEQLNNRELPLRAHTAASDSHTYSFTTDSYVTCTEYNMADWLNLEQVQSALHVKSPSTIWQMCSDPVWEAWPDSDYDVFVQQYYTEIIDTYGVENNGLKLCVYSGDDDSVCGLQGTQYWLDRWEGFTPNPHLEWVAWRDSNDQLGGYYTQYVSDAEADHLNGNVALHFMTVRSAGHMVPTTQPQRALDLLKKYLYEF